MSSDPNNLDSRFGSMNLQQSSSNPQSQTGHDQQQSASARFERFFNSGGSPPPPSAGSSNNSGQYSSGLPSSSSPAFGSFGHSHSQYNSQSQMGGPMGSIGSQAGSSLKPSMLQGQSSSSPGGNGNGNYGSYSSSSASLRNKNSALRSGLPSNWNSDNVSPDSPTIPNNFGGGGNANGTQSNPGSRFLNHNNSSAPSSTPLGGGVGLNDDDIIPTAIVVKNIPFSVVQEQLLQIIVSSFGSFEIRGMSKGNSIDR